MRNDTKHIICYSGGHSSALVAIEVVRRYGKENVILLNHDINAWVEGYDIKRFKKEVADYLGIPITYKNYQDLPVDLLPNQFEIVEIEKSFLSPQTRQALCTSRLKTVPFTEYLNYNFADKNCVIYYGFDEEEPNRIERREAILSNMGYKSDFPLSLWISVGIERYNDFMINEFLKIHNKAHKTKFKLPFFKKIFADTIELAKSFGLIILKDFSTVYERTIFSTDEIGIMPPNSYDMFKHGNCIGCLKAGQQHWYVVYCHYYEIFCRAMLSEERIGYSIIKDNFLKDLEEKFSKMKCAGIEANEHIPFQTFWAKAKKYLKLIEADQKPCECTT